ncbi:MAG TPA: hypothetical protein VIM28_03055 [Solirubrobacterales bacterium]
MSPSPPSKSSLILRIAGICGIVALALCASVAAPAAAADPQLEILTGTEAETVQLQVCPKTGGVPHACSKKDGRPYLGGKLTVLLHSTTKEVKTVEIRYQPKSGTDPIALPGGSDRVFLLGDVENPLKMRHEESLSLTIGFAVPLAESATTIDGSLIVSLKGEKPQIVPVSGEARTFKGVTITPSTLPMDSEDRTATVTLEGPELVEYLRSHGSEESSAILHSEGSDTAEATLTLPSAEDVEVGEHTSRAKATVTLADTDPAAGKYTGKLSLANLSTETGSVSIELHAHDCFWLLVALVLLGIVVTGFGSRLVTTASRRKLLGTVLNQTLEAFRYSARPGAVKAWHLDDLLDEDPGREDSKQKADDAPPAPKGGRLQGLPALLDSISTARSSKDLDEDADRVLDMIARMQRWLRVEPVARRLSRVVEKRTATAELPTEKSKDAEKPALKWGDSKTLRDTRALLRMARQEPADADKADDLVARLLFQIDWHNRMATAWDAVGKGGDPKALQKEARALDEALGDDSKPGKRELAELDGLTARLDALMGNLPKGTTAPDLPQIEGEPIDEDGTELGITPVKWEAAAHLFTGWATLDAQSYGQLSRRAATSSRALYMPGPKDVWQEARKFRLPDVYWTAAILIVTSAAYGATTYSNTWGSCADLATAFLAGSLGKVAVNWAALPIFQSIRLRKAEAG